VLVTVPWDTLTGASDQPAHLDGFGPIPAEMARELAVDGIWRCAATDTHGTILGIGRRTYTPAYSPGAGLRRLTTTLYRECTAPDCHAPALRCEWDHIDPYPHGPTCACNGQPLCKRDHDLKTAGLMHVAPSTNPQHRPGTLIWTTPTGRQYLVRPPSQTPTTPEHELHTFHTHLAARTPRPTAQPKPAAPAAPPGAQPPDDPPF